MKKPPRSPSKTVSPARDALPLGRKRAAARLALSPSQTKTVSSARDALPLGRKRAAARLALSHFDAAGRAHMVDVSGKPATARTARAQAFVRIPPKALAKLSRNPKGDPLEVARIAGIAAAKRAWELIPLCHPLPLTHADVEAHLEAGGVRILTRVATLAPTGVEMEALTAAAVAALTVYDMTKALDKSIAIEDLYLLRKTGGKSGDYRRAGSAQR